MRGSALPRRSRPRPGCTTRCWARRGRVDRRSTAETLRARRLSLCRLPDARLRRLDVSARRRLPDRRPLAGAPSTGLPCASSWSTWRRWRARSRPRSAVPCPSRATGARTSSAARRNRSSSATATSPRRTPGHGLAARRVHGSACVRADASRHTRDAGVQCSRPFHRRGSPLVGTAVRDLDAHQLTTSPGAPGGHLGTAARRLAAAHGRPQPVTRDARRPRGRRARPSGHSGPGRAHRRRRRRLADPLRVREVGRPPDVVFTADVVDWCRCVSGGWRRACPWTVRATRPSPTTSPPPRRPSPRCSRSTWRQNEQR